ncbi:MAG TPA: hypothetical protein VGI81_18215 [Tepidisphaeraceae bacterium]|jgi:hypothetical protein
MALIIPKLVVLDSSTLANVSRDYWNRDGQAREKARTFLAQMHDRAVFIAFTITHVCELLRYDDVEVVKDRLRFLRGISLIAWLRPYDRAWFPGTIADLLARELHARVHDSAAGWRDIIERVRPDLWETGAGADMFVDDLPLWLAVRDEALRIRERERYVASVARTNPGGVNDLKIAEANALPRRPKAEHLGYAGRMAADLNRQLERRGDKRLRSTEQIAKDLTLGTLRDMAEIHALGGDPLESMLKFRGVPRELVGPKTTVGDVGELGVFAARLKQIGSKIRPRVELSVRDVPIDALPSYALQRRLVRVQQSSDRASGSDLGDADIAPLVFYSDAVQVDKRTAEYLTRIQRAQPELTSLMGRFFRSADYTEIPTRFGVR